MGERKEFNEVMLGFYRSESGEIRIDDPRGHGREDQTLNDTLPEGKGLYPIIGLKDDNGTLKEIRILVSARLGFDTTIDEMVQFLKEERDYL